MTFAPAFALTTTSPTCAGDCDNSGAVTVQDLVTLVNVALGADPPAPCGAGDLDADGSITIDEILVAVGHAMNGCPVPAVQVAGGVTALAHGLSYVPLFEPVLSAYFTDAGGEGNCPSGGTFSSTCDDSGGPVIRIPIVAAQCVFPTFEGTATIDGTSTLTGNGLCPSVLVPGGWQMAVHSSVLFESLAPMMLGTGQFDLDAAIQSLGFGAAPCRLRGGAAVLDGTLTYSLPDGSHVTLTASALNTTYQLSEFNVLYDCQPDTITLTLDGALQVVDAHAEPEVSVSATLHGLNITLHRAAGLVELSGSLDAAALGGLATLATATSLQRPLDRPCFTGGALSVQVSGAQTQVAFGSGGSVSVTGGADAGGDATFASCLDAGLRTASVPQP